MSPSLRRGASEAEGWYSAGRMWGGEDGTGGEGEEGRRRTLW